jgi:hypothetical protein
MKTIPFIRVFETAEGWHVGVRGGHYAQEKTKELAIEDATHLAEEANADEIGVYNMQGEVIETLQIKRRAGVLRASGPVAHRRFR